MYNSDDDAPETPIDEAPPAVEQNQALIDEEVWRDLLASGMSVEDIVAAEAASDEHFFRGRTLLDEARPEDLESRGLAIDELKQAAALAPWLGHPHRLLAVAYVYRFEQTGSAEDFAACRFHAEQCLRLDPGNIVAQAVLELADSGPRKKPRKMFLARALRRKSRLHHVFALGTPIVFVGAMILLATVFDEQSAQRAPVAMPAVATRAVDLPVELVVDDEHADGLTVEARRSTLKVHRAIAAYELSAVLRNEGGDEYRELTLWFEVLDAAGERVGEPWSKKVPATFERTMRPGDTISLHELRPIDAGAATIRLRVASSERTL